MTHLSARLYAAHKARLRAERRANRNKRKALTWKCWLGTFAMLGLFAAYVGTLSAFALL